MPVYGTSIQHVKVSNPAKNVLEAAQERIQAIFDRFSFVLVCFSGGKDSTVLLQLALAEAQRRGRVLEVAFCDEEAVDPLTEAYVTEVRSWKGLRFHWLCAPVKHTFQSHQQSFWVCWDPAEETDWIRPRPVWGQTDGQGWQPGMTIMDAFRSLNVGQVPETVCHLSGVRAGESFNRYRDMLTTGSYLKDRGAYWYATPLYDWKTSDIWAMIKREGWPYSRHYDQLRQLGRTNRHTQRIAPIGNVGSVGQADIWGTLYPAFWDRVIRRLPPMESMARYGSSTLYRKGQKNAKPDGITWQTWAFTLLADIQEPEMQAYFRRQIAQYLKRWERVSSVPFPEEAVSKVNDHCWKNVAALIAKHDMINGSSRDQR